MMRLRTRLSVGYLAALIPAFLLFGVLAWLAAREALEEELGRRLTAIADATAAQLMSTRDAGRVARLAEDSQATRERLAEQLERTRSQTGARRIRLINRELRSLVDTQPFEAFAIHYELEADRHEIERAFRGEGSVHSVLFRDEAGAAVLRGYAPVSFEGSVIAVVVVEGTAAFFRLLDRYAEAVLAFGALCCGLVIVVTLILGRRITAPLTSLAEDARRIGAGRFDRPITQASGDEIGELAASIEQMRVQLAARDENLQMMLAGIAHEIRNPLGGMELWMGLLEEDLASEPGHADKARRVRGELDYLKRVVERFLVFAREQPLRWERFDAGQLLMEVRACCIGSAQAAGVTVTVEASEGVELSADRDALRGVLLNLVQNAVQASPSGATVVVRASSPRRGEREVVVEDEGHGMSAEVLATVGRPFFTTREKGTGLGLAFSRKVAEQHGGRLVIASTEGRGTTVRVILPWREDVPVASAREARCASPSVPSPSVRAERSDDDEMIG